jgi:hypothetical protein
MTTTIDATTQRLARRIAIVRCWYHDDRAANRRVNDARATAYADALTIHVWPEGGVTDAYVMFALADFEHANPCPLPATPDRKAWLDNATAAILAAVIAR